MKLGIYYIAFFILFVTVFAKAEHEILDKSFDEITSEALKFKAYSDTLYKYIYRDVDIAESCVLAADQILQSDTPLPDSTILNYKYSRIFHELNMRENLKAYETIIECETELDFENIPFELTAKFNYIKAFTLMIFDDLEAAQKAYLENIKLGKELNDKNIVLINLYSLGQLYSDENDFEEAINCFTEIIENEKPNIISSATIAQTYSELGETYTKLEENEKALKYFDLALEIAEKEKLDVLKSDFLMLKGKIYLTQGKIKEAEKIYATLNKMHSGAYDQNNIVNTQQFLCLLYMKKKMYKDALFTLDTIMKQTHPDDVDLQITNNLNAIEIHEELGNYKKALEYSSANAKLEEQKAADIKRQKTEFLKVKYKSEERERENEILSFKIREGKIKEKFLFVVSAASCLLLFILFIAFNQKARYNKKLKEEVAKRTEKLNLSNTELKEFNKILSHDLKEPVRSIVGFSQLASKTSDPKKIKDQLSFITKSALQLNDLIDNSIRYRYLDYLNTNCTGPSDLSKIIDKVILEGEKKYTDKEILVNKENLVTLSLNPNLIGNLFKSIIDNSIKFNSNKKIILDVSYKNINQTHNIEISDNGIGIPKEYHEEVFNRFARLNNREKYPGSGLGLSIAKKLVEKINGTISIADSNIKKGTTVLIEIPINPS